MRFKQFNENSALEKAIQQIDKNFSEERSQVRDEVNKLVRMVEMGKGDPVELARALTELTKSELQAKAQDPDLKYSVDQHVGMMQRAMAKVTQTEGYSILPDIDRERYQERDGLEGPIMTKSGKVVYYDPYNGGMYYDPDTDMYLTYDEWKALDEGFVDTVKNVASTIGKTVKSAMTPGAVTKAKELNKGKAGPSVAKQSGMKGFKEDTVTERKVDGELMCPEACCGEPVMECTCGPDCEHCNCHEIQRLAKLAESGSEAITEEQFDEAAGEKDACYHKVKSRYKVWPSAYASGALVKCRKVGAANWGNSKK